MRISDWSSDVCSSDLDAEIERLWRARRYPPFDEQRVGAGQRERRFLDVADAARAEDDLAARVDQPPIGIGRAADMIEEQPIAGPGIEAEGLGDVAGVERDRLRLAERDGRALGRSEEHTSELQALMRNSNA